MCVSPDVNQGRKPRERKTGNTSTWPSVHVSVSQKQRSHYLSDSRSTEERSQQGAEEEIGGEEGGQQVWTGLSRSAAAKGKTETVVAGRDRWPLETQAAEGAVRKSEGVPGGRREVQGLRKGGTGAEDTSFFYNTRGHGRGANVSLDPNLQSRLTASVPLGGDRPAPGYGAGSCEVQMN